VKLLPLIGIDELRFGDHTSTVRAAMGEPTETRANSLPKPRTRFDYGSLTLGFGADDRLNFISVGSDVESAELWGEQPFIVAHRSPAVYDNVKDWLAHLGYAIRPHHNCFGARLSVSGQGVTFCFEFPDCVILDGIQLYPE
jgi:hypothetical protein